MAVNDRVVAGAAARLEEATAVCGHDRELGMEMLADIFRHGRAPEPALDGRYRGEMLVVDIAPGLTRAVEALVHRADPWLGKVFDAPGARGQNIISPSAQPGARLIWPFYDGYEREAATTVAFPFQTSIGPGLRDRDRQVLRLDYNVEANPRLTVSVRRIRDEVVQVDEDLYLGKWYVHWYWGTWSLVAYFALRPGGI